MTSAIVRFGAPLLVLGCAGFLAGCSSPATPSKSEVARLRVPGVHALGDTTRISPGGGWNLSYVLMSDGSCSLKAACLAPKLTAGGWQVTAQPGPDGLIMTARDQKVSVGFFEYAQFKRDSYTLAEKLPSPGSGGPPLMVAVVAPVKG
ncbi:hypothetical protein ACGFWD_45320 [Streptomyces sp. NPDC048448]|uniref:hypothetical protein n=1 Tax=Streptomyces sp. NPDC048448 TaxID=3365554 RepID=UPI00371F9084